VDSKQLWNLGAFKVRLSTQFGVPVPKVEAILASVGPPGDAYMCFRVGQVASQPVEVVMKESQAHKEKGWRMIAKNLGIKPGSKEFHDLKKGDLKGDDASQLLFHMHLTNPPSASITSPLI
jgi:hypothetical protein